MVLGGIIEPSIITIRPSHLGGRLINPDHNSGKYMQVVLLTYEELIVALVLMVTYEGRLR